MWTPLAPGAIETMLVPTACPTAFGVTLTVLSAPTSSDSAAGALWANPNTVMEKADCDHSTRRRPIEKFSHCLSPSVLYVA